MNGDGRHHSIAGKFPKSSHLKLTTRNYLFWRTQLVPFLRGQGLIGYIDGELPYPPATITTVATTGSSDGTAATKTPNPAHAVWVQQDQSILSLIISLLSSVRRGNVPLRRPHHLTRCPCFHHSGPGIIDASTLLESTWAIPDASPRR